MSYKQQSVEVGGYTVQISGAGGENVFSFSEPGDIVVISVSEAAMLRVAFNDVTMPTDPGTVESDMMSLSLSAATGPVEIPLPKHRATDTVKIRNDLGSGNPFVVVSLRSAF